jgi:hypothetical protein
LKREYGNPVSKLTEKPAATEATAPAKINFIIMN